jgi:nucleotide-binding universal stress UspA family protein
MRGAGGQGQGLRSAFPAVSLAAMRVYLVVIDDSAESGVALRFAARRAVRTGGGVTVLAVVPPQEFMAFGGVQATIEEEARAKAQATVERAAGALIAEAGLRPSLVVRHGEAARVVRDMIGADPSIAALVLGAAASGPPGPLIAHFAGADAGALPVPVMIVPGSLTAEALDRVS